MTGKAWSKEGAAWLAVHRKILSSPDSVFDVPLKKMGPVTGYFKIIDNQPIVVFIRRGTLDYASTIRPSDAQKLFLGLV